jgi:hypothetical protein
MRSLLPGGQPFIYDFQCEAASLDRRCSRRTIEILTAGLIGNVMRRMRSSATDETAEGEDFTTEAQRAQRSAWGRRRFVGGIV